QRRTAKDHDDRQAYPQHGVDLAMAQPGPADLADGRSDGDGRGRVDAPELEGHEKQQNRKDVEQELHDRRGEITAALWAQAQVCVQPASGKMTPLFRGPFTKGVRDGAGKVGEL